MERMDPAIDQASAGALWVVFARAYHAMEQHVVHSIAALGVGLSDFMVLEALLHKGPQTMSALCESVLLTNSSMTSAADRLAAKKLVVRKADKTDRRVRLLSLTQSGVELAMELYGRHQWDLTAVMKGVTLAERDEARRILKIVGLAAKAAAAKRRL